RLMLVASALTTLGAIPPCRVAAQAGLMVRDPEFRPARLGVAVSTCFAVAAAVTVLAGSLFERWSAASGRLVAGGLVATGGLGIALFVQDWWWLVGAMAVLGAANATCQGTFNRTVATLLPSHRRGLGFGIK